ncbi:MAG: transcriptional repressor [Lautropia sp.]
MPARVVADAHAVARNRSDNGAFRRAAIVGILAGRPRAFTSVREIYRLLHVDGLVVCMATVYSDIRRLRREGTIAGVAVEEEGRPAVHYRLVPPPAARRRRLAA